MPDLYPGVELLESRCLFAVNVPTGSVDTVFASNLTAPTAMDFAPDGRLFVCEQAGSLRVIKDGQLLPTPFVTLDVNSVGERGLLGVAFDPDFDANHFVYVYHTVPAPNLHNQVSRFTADGDVAAGSETDIFDLDPLNPTALNHNGGAIHFGADGKLYIGVGENANASNSQSLNTDLGKLLRINADGSIPADNPFYGNTTGNNRAIWALGLRNPFTFGVQPGTGRIFIDDVGQSAFEEINDGIAGSNYGWPVTEGPTNDPQFRSPLTAYPHGPNNETGVAITGGTFYDPPAAAFGPSFEGTYFFADLGIGFIRNYNPTTDTVTPFATGYQGPVDLKVDAQGRLYILAINEGTVHQIAPASDTLPTPTIARPLVNQRFVAGRRFGFIGTATDSVDGRLKPAALSWEVQFWRDGVEQRVVKTISGRPIGFYDVPRFGDETSGSANVFYRIVLTATNSRGQSASAIHDIRPLTGMIRLLSRVGASRADGLQLTFDGQAVSTPFEFMGIVGAIHTIDAISPQDLNGATFLPLRFPSHHSVLMLLRTQTFVAPFRAGSS